MHTGPVLLIPGVGTNKNMGQLLEWAPMVQSPGVGTNKNIGHVFGHWI